MRVTYIELLGQKHPLVFSLSASEAICERFGGLEKMTAELRCGDIPRVARAADDTISILLQAGRTYCSAMGEELPPPIPCRPADLIDVRSGGLDKILVAISGGAEREVEVEQKNAAATQTASQ